MSVCFKSFEVFHNFSRTAAPVWNHVVSMSQINLFLNKLSDWMIKSSSCGFFAFYKLK